MTAVDGAAEATLLPDGSMVATAGLPLPGMTGLIGPRRLLVVQTIRIARLNSLPVALVPDALVLVSGKGPKDSNDCGKTNLLAAISLLLGDPEWRTAGTVGHQVAGLLFSEGHSGSPRGQYSDATHGYAAGVFAFPGQAEQTAATVWCRINRSNASNQPYVQVRAATGVLLAAGDTARERHDAAERLWASLASQPTWGGNQYARRLYGTSPRCLAHVTYRGFVRSDDRTLLAMKSTVFNPETIARSLIALTGDPEEFTQERDLRRDIAADQEELSRRQQQERQQQDIEDGQLAEIQTRVTARELLTTAEAEWRRLLARGLLDSINDDQRLTEQLDKLDTAIQATEAGVTALKDEIRDLDDPAALNAKIEKAAEQHEQAAAAWREAVTALQGLKLQHDQASQQQRALTEEAGHANPDTLDYAEQATQAASQRLAAADLAKRRADQHLKEAESLLADAKAGVGGEAKAVLAALKANDIPAVSLVDLLELTEEQRAAWEPRLAPFTRGVVIAPADLADARRALRELPGSMLIVHPPTTTGASAADLPAMDAQLTATALPGFLAGLQQRLDVVAIGPAGTPVPSTANDRVLHALDATLGVEVTGGFAEPLTGRAALVAAAETGLREALAAVETANRELLAATEEQRVTTAELAAVHAAVALDEVRRQLGELAGQLPTAAATELRLRSQQEATQEALTGLKLERQTAQQQAQAKRAQLEKVQSQLAELRRRQTDLRIQQAGSPRDAWQQAFGAPVDGAEQLLAGDARSRQELLDDALAPLERALRHVGIEDAPGSATQHEPVADSLGDPDGWAGRDSLLALARTCTQLRRGRFPDDQIPPAAKLTFALRRYLDVHEADDERTAQEIRRLRGERAEQQQALDRRIQERSDGLKLAQRLLITSVTRRIRRVEQELNTLWQGTGRHPVRFDIQQVPPQTPTEKWRWQVIPRWQRGAASRFTDYGELTNDAEIKLFNAMVVLAALLSVDDARGRVLIVDELGDSLGRENLRTVLRAIGEVAQRCQITILATCQDLVVSNAGGYCKALLYLRFPDPVNIINDPTAVWAYTEHGDTVQLTAEAVLQGRSPV
jgi:hypothetical protein